MLAGGAAFSHRVSARARWIARASLDDLARTPGVNAATARAVYDFFHENR